MEPGTNKTRTGWKPVPQECLMHFQWGKIRIARFGRVGQYS